MQQCLGVTQDVGGIYQVKKAVFFLCIANQKFVTISGCFNLKMKFVYINMYTLIRIKDTAELTELIVKIVQH